MGNGPSWTLGEPRHDLRGETVRVTARERSTHTALDEAAVLAAREVVVVLGARLPAEIERWLAMRLAAGRGVVALCGPWCDPAYLRALLERGCTVYDTVIDGESFVFLDQDRGFRLPEGSPVSRAFATLSALLWQRIGEYLLLEGRVSAVYPAQHAFQLAEAERVWLVVKAGSPLPGTGEALSILARVFWGGGTGYAQVFEALAWWPAHRAPEARPIALPAASQPQPNAPRAAPPGASWAGCRTEQGECSDLVASLLPGEAAVTAALARRGCPVCRLVVEAREAFYKRLEDADTAGLAERLLADDVFCASHGWEVARRVPPPALTRLLRPPLASRRALVERLVAAARQPATTLAARRALRAARAAAATSARCPICAAETAVTDAGLHQLLIILGRAEGPATYRGSDGLCMRHLRPALARAPTDLLRLLVGRALAALEALLADIALYYHKASWEFSHEPKGAEQDAWRRGIALWAGSRRAAGDDGRSP